MTTEEKARAYDEALERARRIENGEGDWRYSDLIEITPALTEIFPQLRESEDERIRKWLIDDIKRRSIGWTHSEFTGEQILAWLEKLKEQKPVEWSEEDEKIACTILNLLCSQVTYVTGQGTTSGKQFPTYAKERDWLENRIKSLRPQPKVEWNKQDVDMLNWLIRCCEKEHEELCNDKYGHQDIISDLKCDCRKKWDWLESLKNKVVPQPHWKPSEEQMRALEECGECKRCIKELYEQLKSIQ